MFPQTLLLLFNFSESFSWLALTGSVALGVSMSWNAVAAIFVSAAVPLGSVVFVSCWVWSEQTSTAAILIRVKVDAAFERSQVSQMTLVAVVFVVTIERVVKTVIIVSANLVVIVVIYVAAVRAAVNFVALTITIISLLDCGIVFRIMRSIDRTFVALAMAATFERVATREEIMKTPLVAFSSSHRETFTKFMRIVEILKMMVTTLVHVLVVTDVIGAIACSTVGAVIGPWMKGVLILLGTIMIKGISVGMMTTWAV
jgi:hypothetical protein